MHIIGVFNRDGGTFKTTDMEAFAAKASEVFAAHGHVLEARIVDGKGLIPALKAAAAEGDVLLAGGGDGTISAAAGIAYQTGVPLAVLPAGTMNLFARSLGIPLDLNAALETLATGETRQVDIATANGRPFIHQFSVGIHAKLVKLRQSLTYRSRVGKMIASTRAAISAVARPPNFWAEVRTAQGIERRRTAGITISNNPFAESAMMVADRLDAGLLGIYIIAPLTPWVLVKLCFGVMRGKWKALPEIIDREAREVTIRFPSKKANAVAVIDGELTQLRERIDLKIHPGALKVVMPAAAGAASAPAEAHAATPAQ